MHLQMGTNPITTDAASSVLMTISNDATELTELDLTVGISILSFLCNCVDKDYF